jgi:hypothetical protein
MKSRIPSSNNDVSGSDGKDNDNDSSTPIRRRTLFPTLPRELDIFGFYLSPKHTLVVLLLAIIMFGPIGSKSLQVLYKNMLYDLGKN